MPITACNENTESNINAAPGSADVTSKIFVMQFYDATAVAVHEAEYNKFGFSEVAELYLVKILISIVNNESIQVGPPRAAV